MRRLPREKLVASGKNTPPPLMGAGGEALTLTGWLMGGIRVLSVTWGLLSSVVDSLYALSHRRRGHGVWGELRRQCAGGGEARRSGMSGVRYLFRPEDQQSAVTDLPPTTHLWEPFRPGVGRSSVTEHSPG